jgi:hypothetical protein
MIHDASFRTAYTAHFLHRIRAERRATALLLRKHADSAES